MFWINLNTLSSPLEHSAFLQYSFHEIFALVVLVHRTEEILGQLCAPSSLSSIHERVTLSLPAEALGGSGCQGVLQESQSRDRAVSGCIPKAVTGRDGLSPAGQGRSTSHTSQPSPGEGFGFQRENPGERLHIQQGNSLLGRQVSLAAELAHLCPLQERKKLSPGAARRSRACGTFHLMRILFILSGATNLSSEHFVLIKN